MPICSRKETSGRVWFWRANKLHGDPYHQESQVLNFRMEGLGHYNRPLDRQINEALRIKNSNASIIMNSGAEWRQPALPRAIFSAPGLERRVRS